MANAPKLEIIIGAKADALKAALADLSRSLNALSQDANQAGAQTAGAFAPAETQLGRTSAGVRSVSDQLATAKAQLIGFFSVQYGIGLAKDLIHTADAFTMMNARLKLATQSSAEYTTAQAAIFDISQRTATSLESNIVLYARVADSMRAMGKSQQDALAFTELTGQAMRISGASAESAKAGVTQLAQAMASGVLRGDEFNSIMENSPRLAKALADGLNVPIGKLREMAEAGQLTADKVVGALLSQSATLSAEYAKIPLTVGASLTQLSNAWTKYLGEADQAEGATKSLAQAISDISANFTAYANTILTVGRDALVIWAGFKTITLGVAVAEFLGLTAAARASAAAMAETALANTQAAAAATALATAEKAAAAQAAISAQAHKAVAFAAMAEAEATLAAMKAASMYGPARAAAERAVTAARAGLATATTSLVAAETALAAATARAGAAAAVAAPAVTRLAAASGLLMKALGPLLLAFLAFEGLKVAGQWLGEFVGKLVVGDQEVKKFSSGVKLGMEVAAAATAIMKKETAVLVAEIEKTNGLNAFNQVGESAQAAKDKIKAATAGMVAAFGEIVTKSGDVEKALTQIFNGAEYKTPAGIEALLMALRELEQAGKATGAQIQKSLQDSIDKLDVTQLRGLQTGLQLAEISAHDMANTLDLVVGTALKKLGTDALSVNSGLSKAFRDAEQTFQLFSDNANATAAEIKFAFDKMLDAAKTKQEVEALKAEFDLLKESGKLSAAEIKEEYIKLQAKLNEPINSGLSKAFSDATQTLKLLSNDATATGAQIKDAFNKLIDAAKTKQEAEALKAEFGLLKESGKLSAAEIKDEYARLQAKLNETAGQIDGSLGDAFKRMGIKSAAAMKALADQTVKDFNDIKNSGTASAEGIDAAYQKIKSSVVASIQAMTTASREALQAAKDHTTAVQAGAEAIKSQGTAMVASANAQKADAEYAQASTEAMKSGSAAAREKADALGIAAQAAHAAADAAWADARASQAAAEAAKAEEAAKKAMAAAAANPNEWTKQAAVAAQNFANETARGAEEAKQAAINAQAISAQMSAAAGAASAMASSISSAAAAGAHYASNAAIDANYFSAVADAASDAWRKTTAAVQGYIDQANSAGQQTGYVASLMTNIMSGAQGTGDMATRAMQQLENQLHATADATQRNEDATRAWQSAMDSLTNSAASLKDELDRALGNDKAIEDRAYAEKQRALKEQYDAAMGAAGGETDMRGKANNSQAAADARAAYASAMSDLNKLHNIKLKDIADAAKAKSAADQQNHQDELARIAEEKAARETADVMNRLSLPKADQTTSSSGSQLAQDVAGGVSASAASAGAGDTYHQTLSITTTSLSEEEIRRTVAPVLNKMMAGSR